LYLHDVTEFFSYDPHTVRGTWTIVLTLIFLVIAALLALRMFAPIKTNIVTADEELNEILISAPDVNPANNVVEAK
jgi:hypothetical protein